MTPPTTGITEEQRLELWRFIDLATTGKRHQWPWEVGWQPVRRASGPPVVRRRRFLALEATSLPDSSCLFTVDSLASFLSEPSPLHDGGIRS